MNENPAPPTASPAVPTMDVVAPAPREVQADPNPAQAQKATPEKITEAKVEIPKTNKPPKPIAVILLTLFIAGGLIALAVYAQMQKS